MIAIKEAYFVLSERDFKSAASVFGHSLILVQFEGYAPDIALEFVGIPKGESTPLEKFNIADLFRVMKKDFNVHLLKLEWSEILKRDPFLKNRNLHCHPLKLTDEQKKRLHKQILFLEQTTPKHEIFDIFHSNCTSNLAKFMSEDLGLAINREKYPLRPYQFRNQLIKNNIIGKIPDIIDPHSIDLSMI